MVLVLMHKEYEVLEMWEAPRKAVINRLTDPGSISRNERGSMSVFAIHINLQTRSGPSSKKRVWVANC